MQRVAPLLFALVLATPSPAAPGGREDTRPGSGFSDRGGSWFFAPWALRSATRERNPADYRDAYMGFRVARTLQTADWAVYRNPALRLQVRYPKNWHATQGTDNLLHAVVSVTLGEPRRPGQPRHQVEFWLQRGMNPQGLSVEDWYAGQLRAMHPASPPPTSTRSIAGRTAMRVEYAGTSERRFTFYVALGKADILTILVNEPLSRHEPEEVYRRILDTVELIASR